MRYILLLAALFMTCCQFGMRADTPPFFGGDGDVGRLVLEDGGSSRCDPCIVNMLRCNPSALSAYLDSCKQGDGATIPVNLLTRFRGDRTNDATLQVGVEAETVVDESTMRRAIVEELERMRAAEAEAAEAASDPARFPPSR